MIGKWQKPGYVKCLRGDVLPRRKEGQPIFSWNPNCYHCTIPGCTAAETTETDYKEIKLNHAGGRVEGTPIQSCKDEFVPRQNI